jgi:hypothetical protein
VSATGDTFAVDTAVALPERLFDHTVCPAFATSAARL